MSEPDPDEPATRGGQTRAVILDTALRLFEEQGYERTTMRAIAAEAGVSVGNAYYYFDSKEQLIQAFYDLNGERQVVASGPAMEGSRDLAVRLRSVLRTWVEINAGNHEFAGSFFKHAADPRSPLSPFSRESVPAREAVTEIFRSVVAGSDVKVPPVLRAELPNLLWLYQMGIVLFWVHDRSPGTAKTYELIDRTVPLVVRAIGLARFRVMRGLLDDTLELIASLSGNSLTGRA
ncbi:MAG: TetR family transcriptional regulator [Pseudonocardiales bacterium]|nr:MAG: TetR family transcriptional regulator [Pseudonocardiales bacterium]